MWVEWAGNWASGSGAWQIRWSESGRSSSGSGDILPLTLHSHALLSVLTTCQKESALYAEANQRSTRGGPPWGWGPRSIRGGPPGGWGPIFLVLLRLLMTSIYELQKTPKKFLHTKEQLLKSTATESCDNINKNDIRYMYAQYTNI